MLWAELFESALTGRSRKTHASTGIAGADEDIEHINEIGAAIRGEDGRLPKSVREIMQIGLIGGEPVDPTGHAYVIRSDGKAHFGEESLV